ncbi:hypothetical protein ACGFS9_21270 [Streptomyces sp. NPDC048566]|uniref:hypothetical protein n=1 Tax=Streptomyces sp. NPDC048566 TaxID=3365569 RepID=UPI0037212B69
MSTETPEQILAAADQEVEQADAQLAELESKVIDGDTSVSPDDIEQARKSRWWAGLQRKQAEKRATALREAEADRQRTDAIDQAAAQLAGHPLTDVARKYETAARALAELIDACETRNTAIKAAHRALKPYDGDARLDLADATWGARPYVAVRGVRHAVADSLPGPLVRYLVQRAAAEHPERLPVPGGESVGKAIGRAGMARPPAAATGGF